jgi:hypothetical protein
MKESMDDKRYRMQMEERQGKMYGGRAKYSDGGKTISDLEEELDPDMFMSDEEAEDHQRKLDQDKMDRDLDEADRKFKENQKQGLMSGGMPKYNEGSMLVAPEMGMEDEVPVDPYDNIPEDEMAEAEASQLPDDEMEEDYTSYVLEESLDMEEQEYLMGVLESDERLSGIFDKVMDIAGEFSGEGEVEGLGTGVSDSIPARLSDGEFVFTKKATDQMGADQLQTMMDEAEKAYDGGLMKKAFGGMIDDTPEMEESKEDEEINSMMIASNQMPSVRPR